MSTTIPAPTITNEITEASDAAPDGLITIYVEADGTAHTTHHSDAVAAITGWTDETAAWNTDTNVDGTERIEVLS